MILNQILSTILKANVWRSVWRICVWILGLKGVKTLSIAPTPGIEPMPSALQSSARPTELTLLQLIDYQRNPNQTAKTRKQFPLFLEKHIFCLLSLRSARFDKNFQFQCNTCKLTSWIDSPIDRAYLTTEPRLE